MINALGIVNFPNNAVKIKGMSNYRTIREVARTGLLAEYHLRTLYHQGRLPGIQTGRKFLVNVDLLQEQLEQESRAAVTGIHREDG